MNLLSLILFAVGFSVPYVGVIDIPERFDEHLITGMIQLSFYGLGSIYYKAGS